MYIITSCRLNSATANFSSSSSIVGGANVFASSSNRCIRLGGCFLINPLEFSSSKGISNASAGAMK